jgi:hypothetical protein
MSKGKKKKEKKESRETMYHGGLYRFFYRIIVFHVQWRFWLGQREMVSESERKRREEDSLDGLYHNVTSK